ncbi:NAD(P)-dependent alcohol dehydrogenase [Mariniflexile maritimum]|uniref:NAD(P)-dependent alcohol dehydrogenase n=1 Tax=Mariniflexile maritimum TaxID=2682493 RepID=UPI0012F6504E|nr:NAD(P)-dependent alcohol dehydrogenase [Mariniflexile maritimum]HMR15024.1 NAD(P)-dependent alcohol dehydrogenase [Mariniflexile sp.]
MRAITCEKYGPPNVLKLVDLPKPKPNNNEVLIKIMATTVNSGDVRVRGLKVDGFLLRFFMRLVIGFNKPRNTVLGITFSGIIEKVGKKVSTYKTGDTVFGITGFKFGTYAEYIVLNKNDVFIKKPMNATFAEAAALSFGGSTALYFLNKTAITKMPGLNILIYGATGSVGTAAIEISKYYKAQVTSVCSNEGEKLARKLGSNYVIVYTEADFTLPSNTYDIVFDAVGKISKKDCKKILRENGTYISVKGLDYAKETKAQLTFLKTLFESNQLHANIDKTFSLEEIIEAHEYVDSGRKKGNVVIDINS